MLLRTRKSCEEPMLRFAWNSSWVKLLHSQNTDWNCLLRMSACAVGSNTNFPSIFKGVMPQLEDFWCFMRVQKRLFFVAWSASWSLSVNKLFKYTAYPTELALDFSCQLTCLRLQFFHTLLSHLLEYPISSLAELAECWAETRLAFLSACYLVWD